MLQWLTYMMFRSIQGKEKATHLVIQIKKIRAVVISVLSPVSALNVHANMNSRKTLAFSSLTVSVLLSARFE